METRTERFWRVAAEALENERTFARLMIVVSAIVLIVTSFGLWGDLDHYYANAGDLLDGKMPYSEYQFEYPPLSLVFMLIPRLLTWNLESFHYGCAILTYVFLAIGARFLTKMADEHIGSTWQVRFILLCTVIFGSYFVIARNDVYPAVMTIIALWFFLKARYVPAFAIMSLAALTKLYPGLFIIPMLLFLISERKWKDAALSIVVVAAVGILVELPFLIADPSTAFAYLTYHSDRGIQVESVASGLFMLGTLFVPTDITVGFGYGSDNLIGCAPDALAPWMNPIMAIALMIFAASILVRIWRNRLPTEKKRAVSCAMCAAMLMIFIAFSKVYSAQYYIWIALLLPFTQLSCLSLAHRKEIMLLMVPFGLATAASYLGYGWFGLMDLNALPILLVVVKNLFHLILMYELIHMCWFESGGYPEDRGAFPHLRKHLHAVPISG